MNAAVRIIVELQAVKSLRELLLSSPFLEIETYNGNHSLLPNQLVSPTSVSMVLDLI